MEKIQGKKMEYIFRYHQKIVVKHALNHPTTNNKKKVFKKQLLNMPKIILPLFSLRDLNPYVSCPMGCNNQIRLPCIYYIVPFIFLQIGENGHCLDLELESFYLTTGSIMRHLGSFTSMAFFSVSHNHLIEPIPQRK